ncbi:MAG: lipid-A-disaccharide synthase [Chlamydiota bacterium]
MGKTVDLIVVTGEPSGDAHGQKLTQKLQQRRPDLQIAAVGGDFLRQESIELIFPMERLQTMGFFDLIPSLPKIAYWFFFLRKKILALNPKGVVFIDYPGFNLRLQRSLRKKGYKGKLIQYICPSVWAWSKGRIPLMEQSLDLLLTIFPFEEALFQNSPLEARYVGNPSYEEISIHESRKKKGGSWEKHAKGPLLALFPGSRKKEIYRNFPLQILAAKEVSATPVVSCAKKEHEPLLRSIMEQNHFSAEIVRGDRRHDLMQSADMAIATSGTVTLELALFGTPTLVTFAIPTKDYLFAAKCLRIDLPFYCIVNILENAPIFPELFGPNLTPARVKYWAKHWLSNEERRKDCKENLKTLQNRLGKRGKTAEEAILFEIGV